ncbi:hypothetical protein P8625_11925 [Tenacibaculum tangerinum]|uniref:tRNA modification GTPase n=1 Tax=Tenacibaculum tangerinum TaxID=3038772 RepID=A0ABY8L0B6_9FLAO|nr:hypothetical protein [Tenacibaculum tangerinum]WGH74785.1 hypothetical protein P8625_11925 [Tenacibaculum tangerinum]
MKRILSYLAIFIATMNCYAQITFEKGYFISNQGERVECLIKNVDWKDSPEEFIYKETSTSSPKTNKINYVKEFGVYNFSKYIKAYVNIDKSSDLPESFSDVRNPIFEKETLFLKVLIEGDASLFYYGNRNLKRFFFKKDNDTIKQFIHKKYLSSNGGVKTGSIHINERYKQQISNSFKCSKISIKQIESLSYKESSLSNFFIKYNQCKNAEFKQFNKNKNKSSFELTAKIGLNNSSLQSNDESYNDNNRNTRSVNYGSKTGMRFGLEGELILPFNRNKWSLFLEGSYQYFKKQKTTESDFVVGGVLIHETDYKSIEAVLGLKYYFFLNEKSKIAIALGYLQDTPINSTIVIERKDGTTFDFLEIGGGSSLVIATAYEYNKYSIELRYNSRNLYANSYTPWLFDYNSLSLNIGYTIF